MKNEVEIRIFADAVEATALEQIRQISRHPAIRGPVAIMPDVHAGAGCVVGFTGRFGDAVIPNIVGVDLGCGVAALALGDSGAIDLPRLDQAIRLRIPLGRNRHRDGRALEAPGIPQRLCSEAEVLCADIESNFYRREVKKAGIAPISQLGTLGGGNHFIEIGRSDKDGGLWLIVHSGSRNFGKQVAEHFQALARSLTGKNGRPPAGLEALPLALGGDRYLRWAETAQRYARLNRRLILAAIADILGRRYDDDAIVESVHNAIDPLDRIIRKGAIPARCGEKVIIPFNMASGTLLGIGRGNAAMNDSAPHGAGRRYSRSAMRRQLENDPERLQDFQKRMQGIFSTSINRDTFDESPLAYKDPAAILPYLEEAVTISERLRPVYNLKAAE